jgi:hypothetical protein
MAIGRSSGQDLAAIVKVFLLGRFLECHVPEKCHASARRDSSHDE